jgi:TetR/AcrR family fatty acid metabolism transcriptional regulator
MVMLTTKRNTAPASDTRESILDATERLLARYGYQKTTMDDVAREARIGKGTTYLYFPSKEELTLATIDRIVDRLLKRLRAIACTKEPAPKRLRDMLLTRVLFRFDSVRDYSQSLDDLLASLRTAYLARRQSYFDAEAEVFAEVLRSGLDARQFAFGDARLTAHTLLLATNALLPSGLSAKELGRRRDVQRKTECIADLLLNGLLRRP